MTVHSILRALRRALPMIGAALLGVAWAMMTSQPPSPHSHGSTAHRRPAQIAWVVVTILAVGAMLLVAFEAPRLAAAGWLIALTTLSTIPLGALAWLMVHRLTGGQWGDGLRPTFEAAVTAIPLLAVAAIPALVAMPILYPWVTGGSGIKADVVAFYLNAPMFIVRAGIAWIGWSVLALLLHRARNGAGVLLAAAGLVFHAVMVSLLSVDWILSVEPAFISTSFGATVAFTQMLAALAFAALFAPGLNQAVVRDLGGLMLAVTLGVTYLNFMAVLVMWYGDLPTKITWFAARTDQPWAAMAVAIFFLGALIPILLLLLASVRESRVALHFVACSSLAGIALYGAWLLAPAYGTWSLGAALLAAIALACLSILFVRACWLAVPFVRARQTS